MKITILDGGTTNPGDISWDEIAVLGDLTVYDETPKELVVERLQGADMAIITRINMSREVISKLPDLKYIGTLATGYNPIDLEATSERGIVVCNVPHYCTNTVAQMVFSHILNLCNHVDIHTKLVKDIKWKESLEFERNEAPFFELSGKTIGIVGYGTIGQKVAEIAKVFGMNVLVYSKSPKDIKTVSLKDLFKNSDVVSLHCALNAETTGLVNLELLKTMKPTSFIINTARGAVINEADLAFALNNGIIAGAGVDVLSEEPPSESFPLLKAKNCYITPHIAWASKEARKRLVTVVAENIKGFLENNIKNRVG